MARAFERPATIALPGADGESGFALEGLYVPAPGAAEGAVIAPPHPLMGGSMESPVVGEVAWQCQKVGVSSLRFNWRGVGGSAGQASGEEGQADVDFRAALEFMRETVPGPQLACGYSFGAAAAVRAALVVPSIRSLILVAPPTSMMDFSALQNFQGRIVLIAGEKDEWVNAEVLAEFVSDAPAAQLQVIAGCDHFFMRELDELGRALAEWWGRPPSVA